MQFEDIRSQLFQISVYGPFSVKAVLQQIGTVQEVESAESWKTLSVF